jgi:hypothetical protein
MDWERKCSEKDNKTKNARERRLAAPIKTADRWFIEECGVAVRWEISGFLVKKSLNF